MGSDGREALRRAFPTCDEATLNAGLTHLQPCRLKIGEVLLQIDEPGHCADLLLEGALQVCGGGQDQRLVAIATLDTPERLVGVQELMALQPLRQEAITETPVKVLPISRERLRQLPGRAEIAASLQVWWRCPAWAAHTAATTSRTASVS